MLKLKSSGAKASEQVGLSLSMWLTLSMQLILSTRLALSLCLTLKALPVLVKAWVKPLVKAQAQAGARVMMVWGLEIFE